MHILWKQVWLVILATSVLAGCQVETTPTGVINTPELVSIQYTPGLSGLTPVFHQCAVEQGSEFALITNQVTTQNLDLARADMVLRCGAQENLANHVAELSKAAIIFIVNPVNPLTQLSFTELQGIYTAQVISWADLDPSLEQLGDIQVWAYSENEDIQEIAEKYLSEPAAPSALLAPHPDAMLQAVNEDPSAIGFIPSINLQEMVHAVTVEPPGGEDQFPILLMTNTPLDGRGKSFALCLQDALNKIE